MSSKRLCKVSVLCKNSSALDPSGQYSSTCSSNLDFPKQCWAPQLFACWTRVLFVPDEAVRQSAARLAGATAYPLRICNGVFQQSSRVQTSCHLAEIRKNKTTPGAWGWKFWENCLSPLSKHAGAVRQSQNYTGVNLGKRQSRPSTLRTPGD